MDNATTARKGFLPNLSRAPIELKLFIGFTLVVSVASLVIAFILPDHVKEVIIPVTGWPLGLTYSFSLIITLGNLNSTPGNRKRMSIQLGNILLLVVTIALHLVQMSNQVEGVVENPYLSISPYRPIWAMIIPSIWILVLLSPNVKRYCLPE